jgi:hypothetical protein
MARKPKIETPVTAPAPPEPPSEALARLESTKAGDPDTAAPRPEPLPPAKDPRTGRPSLYNPDIAARVCDMIAEGVPLYRICRDEDWSPPMMTFLGWVRKDHDGLTVRYARARESGWNVMAEQLLEIADDSSMDREADGRVNNEHVNRSRLRVDTIKWLLSKFLPKQFGDKLEVNPGAAGEVAGLTDTQVNVRLEVRVRTILEPLFRRNPTPTLEDVVAAFRVAPLPKE